MRVILSLFICLLSTAVHSESKIGVILPLTGDFGYFGEEFRQGAELAASEIKKGDNQELQLVFEDDHCLGKDAVTAFKSLQSRGDIQLVIGPACSASILAVAPAARSTTFPVLFTLDGGEPVASLPDPLYTIGFDPAKMARTLADDLMKRGQKKVAILQEEEEYAQLIARSFEAEWIKDGGSITAFLSQPLSDRNFRPVVTKLLSSKPDAIFFSSAYESGSFLRQLRTMSKTVPVYGNDTMCVAATIEVAKEAADGSRCANVIVDNTKEPGKKFRTLFEARYTKIPSSLFYAALGYDSVIVGQQILTGSKSRVSTVLGAHTKSENGLYELLPEILEIRSGKMIVAP